LQYREIFILSEYSGLPEVGKLGGNIDYTITTDNGVEEVAEMLQESLKEKGYGILSRIDVQKILKEKNDQTIEPYLILDVCNPKHAGNAIQTHKDVGLVLPCKISIYRENDSTKVSLLKPTEAIKLTGLDGLDELAGSVEVELQQTIKSMIE